MRAIQDESGQALVLSALCMTVLLGFIGLGVDVGMLFQAKRQAQTAADAAAFAAGLDYKYNQSSTSATAAGIAAASQNGITNGTGGAVVTVNVPPASGPNAGANGFIEALVTNPSTTFFMRMFNKNSIAVSARAVISVSGNQNSSGCIWTLAKSGTDVSLSGGTNVEIQNCNIYDDSSANNALSMSGSSSLSAKSIGIVGKYSDSSSGTLSPNPITGMAPAADPLANLPVPTISTGTCSGGSCSLSFRDSNNHTVNPGTYTSISNSGTGTVTLASGNYIISGSVSNSGGGTISFGAGNYSIGGSVTNSSSSSMSLGSGLYTIAGNLSVSGSGSFTASEATFYTQGTTSISGGSNLSITAPTSGTYDGVLFFQSRSDSSQVSLTGSTGSVIQGIIYAPAAKLTLTGSSAMTTSLDIITDSLVLSGTGKITNSNYAQVTNSSSVLSAKTILVE